MSRRVLFRESQRRKRSIMIQAFARLSIGGLESPSPPKKRWALVLKAD
jgi:hypothetical protein